MDAKKNNSLTPGGLMNPGNVRELENAIERACVLADTATIHLCDLPPEFAREAAELAPMTIPTDAAPPVPKSSDTVFPLPKETAPNSVNHITTATMSPLGHLKNFLREQELAYLNRALDQNGGDKEKAAALLGISIATLYRKLSPDGDE